MPPAGCWSNAGFEKYRESAVVYYGQPTTIVFYRYDFQKRTWFAAK